MITEHASLTTAAQDAGAQAVPAAGLRRWARAVAVSAVMATALSGCSTIDWLTDLGAPDDEYATASIPTVPAQSAVQTGVAAWDGDISAPGMSAAHPYLMPGSWARVTNMTTGQAAVVRITRRMTPARGRDIELSRDAAAAVGALQQGVANVLIEPIDPRQAAPSEMAWSPPPSAPVSRSIPAPAPVASAGGGGVDVYDPDIETASIPGPSVAYRPSAPRSVTSYGAAAYEPHYLQLGSFRDRLNAERLAARLDAGHLGGGAYGDAFVETAYVDGAVFHRVRLGPLESPEMAERALQEARALGHNARILKP